MRIGCDSFLFLLVSCSLRCWNVHSQDFDLGGGLTVSSTAKPYADLSQDVSEIGNLVKSNSIADAINVYQNGQHSQKSTGLKISLKSLGDELAASNPHTPAFLFHLYGQSELSVSLALDQPKLEYVNTYVLGTFATRPQVAVEAIRIVNLWMYATHLLFSGVYDCDNRSRASNPSLFDIGLAGWDKFIALYIGSGQTPAQTDGSSLYSWAQRLGNQMGTSDPEAQVNTRVKLIYQEALATLSVAGYCTTSNPQTAAKLWSLAIQVVSEMSKPLFQGLIVAINNNNQDLIAIYAHALVPLFAKCRSSLYKLFYDALITNSYSGASSRLFQLIPEAAFCFGYSCSELGNTTIPQCPTFNYKKPVFAGYLPSTPVGNVGKADLDVLQMKILAGMNANDFARLLYLYGGNIDKYREGNDPLEYVSLHDISVTTERTNAKPWYAMFVKFNNDSDYADHAILDALSGNSKWKASQQIAAIVGSTAAFQILLFEAMSKLGIAVDQCRKSVGQADPSFVLNPIDETAALLIGSMEGPQLGGSPDLQDGQLIYNINNKHAFQFGTMGKNKQYSRSVSTIEDLLFAAKAQLASLDCDNLAKTTSDILRFSMVGIAQAGIFFAVKNDNLNAFSTSDSLAEAEGVALSILPIIGDNDAATGAQLKANMVRVQGTDPVSSGAQAVGKLFGKGFTYSMKLDCSFLGALSQVNPCDGQWGKVSFERSGAFTTMGLSGTLAATIGLALLLLL